MGWYVLMEHVAVDPITPRRAKTAIRRYTCSRPVALAFADGLISSADTFFDFGCGHGADVRYLRRQKVKATGWDPFHFPRLQSQQMLSTWDLF